MAAKRSQCDNENLDPRREIVDYVKGPITPHTEDFDLFRWWRVSSLSITSLLCYSNAMTLKLHSVQFPILASMAQDYLAIQGSSVPCERAFSSSKHTDSYLHSWMSADLFGALQIAKSGIKNEHMDVDY
jgi:hypothetical protein